MSTYATINNASSLYLFDGMPDDKYGVITAAGKKRIWSSDGSVSETTHRNVKYYADITGLSYAEAFSSCERAHAEYQDEQQRRIQKREKREQERIAEQYESVAGLYRVEVPCLRVALNGSEVRTSFVRTVEGTSKANAWMKAVDAIPPHLIMPEMLDRCHIEYVGKEA